MTKKEILRVLAQIIVVVIIAICAWCLLPSFFGGYVTGFVGCIVVSIYGTLIEKGKL